MSGVRLGFTYAAALVLLGLLIAVVTAPGQARGKVVQANARPIPPGFFRFTAAPVRTAKAAPQAGSQRKQRPG
ncbi:MAG: hypothetical protein H7268_15845 [Sandarakinorhabdus sp.]|nr:hypothetical protein [Sandarakinorhabdus sp.]